VAAEGPEEICLKSGRPLFKGKEKVDREGSRRPGRVSVDTLDWETKEIVILATHGQQIGGEVPRIGRYP
jgi:hypothetical protein